MAKFKMNKIGILALVLVLVLTLAGCTTSNELKIEEGDVVGQAAIDYFANMPEDIYKIPQDTFVEKVKAGEDMFILDIRQEDVYNEGHIKGAINAPWGTAISDNLEKLPMDKTIMVYCYTGQTAGQAVATLNMAGFDAKSVNLGWNLGIAKVDGVDDVIETTANEFTDAKSTVDPTIKAAIEDYYKGLEALKGTTYANYKISEEDTKELVDSKDENTFILSIRSAEDFAKEKIEGAINIPWGKGMEKEFGKLPKDKKIIVYCYTGQTAGQAVAGLRLLGFDAVSLNGGMGTPANAPSGWINKGFSSGPKVESDGQDNS